jgi:hypothetical protein
MITTVADPAELEEISAQAWMPVYGARDAFVATP